jgi:hypothetical protein
MNRTRSHSAAAKERKTNEENCRSDVSELEECSSPKVRVFFGQRQIEALTRRSPMAKSWLANGKVLLE